MTSRIYTPALTLPSLTAALLLAGILAAPPPARAQQRDHCGTITSNETWTPAGNPHVVTCDVTVRNSRLTLAAGTTVLMAEGTSLTIGPGSSLEAVGDPTTGNINLRTNSPQDVPGFWGQIKFEAGAADSRMDLMIVRGGGAKGVPMIEVEDAVVEINRSQLRLAAGPVMSFWPNSLGPSLELAGQATTDYDCVDKPHPLLILDRNATIAVRAGEHQVVDSQSWHHFCVPYLVSGDLVVAGPDEPLLMLDRGTTLRFEPEKSLIIGASEDAMGALDANGSLDQPVVLTGQTAVPGSWGGVDLTAFAGFSTLITALVEYGGHGGRPMVQVSTLDATALDVRFNHALGYPIAVNADSVGSFLAGVGADPEQAAFEGNGTQRVLVVTNPDGEDVTTSAAEWPDVGVPYEVDGTLTVGNDGLPAGLTLLPGVTVLFRPGQTLQVTAAGALVAKGVRAGALDLPVTLAAVDRSAGAWGGIEVQDMADVVQMDLAVVADGGAEDAPMVRWGAADGTVTRTLFRGAAGYPVIVPLSRAPDVIMGADQLSPGVDMRNRFQDNGANRVLVHVDGPVTGARLKDWADPGAPVEFDATVLAASIAGPRLVWHDGLDLRFRQGDGIHLSGSGQIGVVEVADVDPERPVRLGPVNAAEGWSGLAIRAGGVLSGADLHLGGVPADGVHVAVDGGRVEMASLQVVGQGHGIGLDAGMGGQVTLLGSRFEGLAVGIRTREGARLDISRSVVQGNTSWGIRNEDPTRCQRALQVWWGVATGPQDGSNALDGCMNASNASPGADQVSDGVEWWPYALNATDFAPSPGVGPNPKRLYLPWGSRP